MVRVPEEFRSKDVLLESSGKHSPWRLSEANFESA